MLGHTNEGYNPCWTKNIIYVLKVSKTTIGEVQKKWGVLSVMLFIMISAFKSMYGQDKRITLIHMLSANKSEYFDIYFSMSAIDTFWGIPLRSMHYTEDTTWHKKNTTPEYRSSVISAKVSTTDMEKYISKHSEMSAQEKCVSAILLPWT